MSSGRVAWIARLSCPVDQLEGAAVLVGDRQRRVERHDPRCVDEPAHFSGSREEDNAAGLGDVYVRP